MSDPPRSRSSELAPPTFEVRPEPPGRLPVFAYTVEGLAPLYRAIMRAIAAAKASYRIQLRPDEVAAEVQRRGEGVELPEDGVERALDQLVEWGNLRRTHDTGRVSTLEDFRRRHFLYQITPAGEAAERAVGAVVDALASSGSLQTVMLGAILRNLATLAAELASEEPAPAVLFEALFNVNEQFRALTENAGIFLSRLHEAIDAGEIHTEAFIAYKQAVIAYLEEFVGELASLAPQITRRVQEVEQLGVDRLTAGAAQADAAPTLGGVRDASSELARRWRGVAAWFVGDGRQTPTVELLRGAARSAINRILMVLERLHEKRFRRVNRTADLLRLASWFEALGSAADGDAEAHRLYQVAFGLHSARHLGGFDEEAEAVQPATSWWQAPPVEVAPALRETGRLSAPGRPARIVDYAAARRHLAERHRRERRVLGAALERFAGCGPLALGDLPRLADEELDLLLVLLDRLLSVAPDGEGRRRSRSRDGRLHLLLEPPPADGELAVVRTARGRLTLPAFTLSVDDLGSVATAAVEGVR